MLQNIQNTINTQGYYTPNRSNSAATSSYTANQFTQPTVLLNSLYQVLSQLISQLSGSQYNQGGFSQPAAQPFNQQGQYQPGQANTSNYFQQAKPEYHAQAQQSFQVSPHINNRVSYAPTHQTAGQNYQQPMASQANANMPQPMAPQAPANMPQPMMADQPALAARNTMGANPQTAGATIGAQTANGFRPNLNNVTLVPVATNSDFNNAFQGYDNQKDLRAKVINFSQNAGYGFGTGTGLDHIVSTILADEGLTAQADGDNVTGGAYTANALNHLFVRAVQATGADADGQFTTEELEAISKLVQAEYKELYTELHGDDENGEETGFHLVQNNGGKTTLNLDGTSRNAVNTIFDGFYHFGFDINDNDQYLNEDGNANQKVQDVANWLNDLYFQAPDQTQGHAQAVAGFGQNPSFAGAFNSFNGAQTHKGGDLQQSLAQYSYAAANGLETGTGLDSIVTNILNDEGLQTKISNADRRGGAYAANALNHLFNGVATAIGATADGRFTETEVKTVNEIINEQYGDIFKKLHGDDEGNEETGFHLVQNDGATTNLKLDNTNRNAVNTIYDGFYHFGFETANGRFLNEDGNANQKISDVTNWLNAIYFDKEPAE